MTDTNDTPKNNAGRKPMEIDGRKVRTLASYGCKTEEIAAFFECSSDTIERRFMEEMRDGRRARNANLRAIQFKLAAKSAAMAIFLGKNYLGQSDRIMIDDGSAAAAAHAAAIKKNRENRMASIAEAEKKQATREVPN